MSLAARLGIQINRPPGRRSADVAASSRPPAPSEDSATVRRPVPADPVTVRRPVPEPVSAAVRCPVLEDAGPRLLSPLHPLPRRRRASTSSPSYFA
ncbi:MAG: hypothetical protein ACR2KV_17185, partial [Solirubrobacteraceae bacterium]